MKRISMVLVVMVWLVLTTAPAFTAGAREPAVEPVHTLQLNHIFPTDHPTHRAVQEMADYVREQSAGRLVIEVHASGALGGGGAQAENISMGTIDAGTAGPGMISTMEPAFGLLAGEYVFRSVESMYAVLDGPVGERINQRLLENNGVRVLSVAYVGKRHLTANRPVRTPEDMRGLRVRIPDIPTRAAAFRAWGASPTPLAFAELYLALSQGAVDAQENPFAQIVTMKFYEVQDYLILTGHAMNAELLLINERAYQALPDELKDVLREGAEVYRDKQWQLYEEQRDEYLEYLAGKMTIIEPDVGAFAEAARVVPYEFEDRWGRGLYDEILKAQEEYRADWE